LVASLVGNYVVGTTPCARKEGKMRDRTQAASFAVLPVILAQDGGEGLDFSIGTILLYILVGAVIGIIARLLVPGTGGMSWLLTLVIGIVGALIGGYLWEAIFGEQEGIAWIGSIIVAALLVWLVTRMGAYGRAPRRRAM
jgi:uncharacterized membrane protein YeaQ/YmgE (transglycosylase-associated protein family)